MNLVDVTTATIVQRARVLNTIHAGTETVLPAALDTMATMAIIATDTEVLGLPHSPPVDPIQPQVPAAVHMLALSNSYPPPLAV
jgi:hypothetical protein